MTRGIFRDWQLACAFALGPGACLALVATTSVNLNPCWPQPGLWLFFSAIIAYPVLEEWIFRGNLQPWLAQRLAVSKGLLTSSNVLTSVIFTGLHFFFHPPLWAAGVFLPSLVFGYFRERHASLISPILLHASYNASYFFLLA